MSASAQVAYLDDAEPGIHPVAAKIRDIILSKAVDGQPAMEEDFAEIPLGAFKTHFNAGKAAAHRIVVRQVDDGRGFESRAQLLTRATLLIMGQMPTELNMHHRLRVHGLSNAEIADLWPDLLETVSDSFKRLRARCPSTPVPIRPVEG